MTPESAPLTAESLLRPFLPDAGMPVAAAVSGGPDSLALAYALCRCAQGPVHILTVDHGLRAEAADEARAVAQMAAAWPRAIPAILTRKAPAAPAARIQETARRDRYALLARYCAAHGIGILFLAHHRDDQAETFLFRLAKGSGLDGLCAMRPLQKLDGGPLLLARPFLDIPKSDLIAYCREHALPFAQDPSNENPRFARARLRRSREILEKEGLSAKRLAVTAARLAAARDALEFFTEKAFSQSLLENNPDRIVFNTDPLQEQPEDIRLRILLRAAARLRSPGGYAPRLERLEMLTRRIFGDPLFRRATLGGLLFTLDRKNARLCIETESAHPAQNR